MRHLVAIVLLAFLTGCGPGDVRVESDWNKQIWVDPVTKCEYHFWQSGYKSSNNYAIALAPRIGEDRLPVCNKK